MKEIVNKFIADKKPAIAGVSRDPMKFGRMIYTQLKKKGYSPAAVNPLAGDIEGEPCYSNVSEIPENIESVILTVPAAKTEAILEDCVKAGVKRVWMHNGAGGGGAYSEKAHDFCKKNNIDVVYGVCPMMLFPNPGIHKVHFFFKKLFRTLPKEWQEA